MGDESEQCVFLAFPLVVDSTAGDYQTNRRDRSGVRVQRAQLVQEGGVRLLDTFGVVAWQVGSE